MKNFDHFRIDGHTLRVFVSVCETGSVSQTAAIFALNQSTISHTLEKMRAAVGDPLFVKSGRGITPTVKAISLLPRVQQILVDIEGLIAPEHYEASLDSKPVVVAIPTPALLNDMKTLQAKISDEAKHAKLEIRRLAPRSRIAEMLTHDEAELAIAVSGFKYPATLNHCIYGKDEFVVFYDPNHRGPITSAEEFAAARHGTVNFGGGVKSEVEKSLARLGLEREVTLVAPTASMLGDLVRGTDIVATMARRLVTNAYMGLAYSAPPFELPAITYDLVWHRRYEHSGRHMWLRKLVMESRGEPLDEA